MKRTGNDQITTNIVSLYTDLYHHCVRNHFQMSLMAC